jgi:hypothetical protein
MGSVASPSGGRALTAAGTFFPPRSPEPSKTLVLGTSEDGLEPVSPPEGMAEPGHPRSAVYPLLYRDGEQAEPRYPVAKTSPQRLHPYPRPSSGSAEFGASFSAQLGGLDLHSHCHKLGGRRCTSLCVYEGGVQ